MSRLTLRFVADALRLLTEAGIPHIKPDNAHHVAPGSYVKFWILGGKVG